MSLIECVPNFSEGRRPEVVTAIVDAMRVSGVSIIDVSSDADHNRTVVTLVGDIDPIAEAAYRGVKAAAALIDMRQQSGVHPRIGAADVVPLIPLREVSLAECVSTARKLGARIGSELGLPVFLYDAAALRPDRVTLPQVRRDPYETLVGSVGADPTRTPDYGPSALGSAGAVAVGARGPLIAFNAYLDTDDLSVAQAVAREIRESGGGLPRVRALGLLVDGAAQVSMNLTDFQRTPVARVVELIRREAARYGVGVTHSELVGLAPQAFFIDAAQWYLQLDRFEPDQILEYRVQQAEAEPSPLDQEEPPIPEEATQHVPAVAPETISPARFVEAVAAGTATPGGGAVAALAGALSAALAEMVARLTAGKKRYAEVEQTMNAVAAAAADLRARLMAAIDADIAAFDAVMAAYRVDKDDPARPAAIQAAMIGAADVPLDVARMAVEAMQLAEQVARLGNHTAASDAAVATLMGIAAVEGAGLNVRVNAASFEDRTLAARYTDDCAALLAQARALRDNAIATAEERAGIAPTAG